MKRFAAILAVAAVLAAPGHALAVDTWEDVKYEIKDEWEYRPYALFLAAPALLITMPFIGVKILLERLEEDDE